MMMTRHNPTDMEYEDMDRPGPDAGVARLRELRTLENILYGEAPLTEEQRVSIENRIGALREQCS